MPDKASRIEPRTTARLDQPQIGRRRNTDWLRWIRRFDTDAFGRFSEKVARFLGTGQFLLIQTITVICWIAINMIGWQLQWDPYPFVFLNLAFSTQAAYAAPLILLAQNRQAARERVTLDEDRARAQAAKADTEFLARELAALRIALGEVATRDFIRDEVVRLLEENQKHEEARS